MLFCKIAIRSSKISGRNVSKIAGFVGLSNVFRNFATKLPNNLETDGTVNINVGDINNYNSVPNEAFSQRSTTSSTAGNGSVAKEILDNAGIQLIYEDNHIIVCSKPPNMLSQSDFKTEESDTILGILKSYIKVKYDKKGDVFLGLLHRLDRPCSGIMIFARNSKSAARLSEHFKLRSISKKYVCIVEGIVASAGKIDNYIIPSTGKEVKVKVSREGPENCLAKLVYKPIQTFKFSDNGKVHNLTVLEVMLETGRKHQIRAQLSNAGYPIFGDSKYGSKLKFPTHLVCLHSRELSVVHPVSKEKVRLFFSSY